MSRPDLINRLSAHHQETLTLSESLTDDALRAQYHPLLSPLGWHVGHCSFIETLWVQAELLGDWRHIQRWQGLYQPDMAYKPGRGERLPAGDALVEWCAERHAENVAVLTDPPRRLRDHRLLRDDYLPCFLLQHYAQHLETMDYVRAQRDAACRPDCTGSVGRGAAGWVVLEPGRYRIGRDTVEAYDNEHAPHEVDLPGARLAGRPVSNAEFAAFIEDDGYRRPALWDADGWRWCVRRGIDRPGYWQTDEDGRPADAHAPVLGLSYYEATAHARWADARLPHEYEWEAAHTRGLLSDVGGAWEWCANPFHPYPGFQPFPYDGYSRPWFDGAHFVLKGASPSTRPSVRRPSFRNFYTRDIRHVFSGLRLALDL